MEKFHYDFGRQTCQIFKFLSRQHKISGAPVNFPDEDGVAFKYIFANVQKEEKVI
jgi:hypothetical protein